MTSAVDIANTALSHVGDAAQVESLDLPHQTVQAQHCARFYPIARDALLEWHDWGFATRRVLGSSVTLATVDSNIWTYGYAWPNQALKIQRVLNPSNANPVDTDAPPWELGTAADGSRVVFTDQAEAVLQYTVQVTDPRKFSPLFVTALGLYLGAMLAGPIIKGKAGEATATRLQRAALAHLPAATTADANQQHKPVTPAVGWITNR